MCKNDKILKEFYEKAVSAIAAGIRVDEFTEICYHFFHMDVIIVDEGYRLISCAGRRPYADPYWEVLADAGSPTEETILNDYLKEGYLNAIAESDGAIFVNWGICHDYPQTSGPIYINKQLSGFVSLLFLDMERKDFALKLNASLCQLYAILLNTNSMRNRQTQNPVREVFATQLFDTMRYPKPPKLDDYRPFIDIRPPFMIAVVHSCNKNRPVLEHTRGRIRSIFPDFIYLYQGEYLYLFLNDIYEGRTKNVVNKFKELLTEYKLQMGCSQLFDRIEKRDAYIQQAEFALKTGSRLSPDKQMFYYSDYYIPSVLFDAADRLYVENAIPPQLLQLRRFDEKNQTDYTESLKVYLYERNNLNRAAARLHLHRNSLKYRLDKITDLTGLSPDDPETAQRMQIGFLILELKKRAAAPED